MKRIQEEETPLLQSSNPSSNPSSSGNVTKKEQLRLPKRTTKTSQKLTLFPTNDLQEEQLEQDVLPHVGQSASKEEWLQKLERKYLPRVTAYSVANMVDLTGLEEWLRHRPHVHRCAPRR